MRLRINSEGFYICLIICRNTAQTIDKHLTFVSSHMFMFFTSVLIILVLRTIVTPLVYKGK